MNKPGVRWPRSCPKCGFDMEPGKPCQVCGYSPSNSPARAPAVTPGAKGRRRRPGVLLVTLAGCAGVLVLGAAGFLLARHGLSPARAPVAASPALPSQAASGRPSAYAQDPPILLNPEETPYDITKRTENPPYSSKEAFVAWMARHTDQKAGFLEQRWDLAQTLRSWRDLNHTRVWKAFLRTPREFFARNPRRAYANVALPIGYGQTISGPDLVSHMTDYLDPVPDQKVLEIGTGSGYQSAFLSELSGHVFTVEIIEPLARETDAIFKSLEGRYPEYRNVHRKVDDGYYGWAQYAPFDKIIVTCGIDHVPPPLIQQLAPNGTMVIPIGPPSGQTVLRIVKKVAPDGTVTLSREDIYHGRVKVRFVPLTTWGGGAHPAE